MHRNDVIRALQELGFHARPQPGFGERAIWVSRPDLFFEEGESVRGWRSARILLVDPPRWKVLSPRIGSAQPAEEASFDSFEAAVGFIRTLFDERSLTH